MKSKHRPGKVPTQTDTWKRLMESELADLVITDPPHLLAKRRCPLKSYDAMSDGNFYQRPCMTLYRPFISAESEVWWHGTLILARTACHLADLGMVKQCLICKNSILRDDKIIIGNTNSFFTGFRAKDGDPDRKAPRRSTDHKE